ncbi:lysoplasmalogenase family protein [Archangium violaceum]|uniref:lysoplasmalogenase family protein n=1 Tax=Archangium violaceum TaxID=83451 RepID=UPI001EF0A5C9|nr:lysoplasmalogenase family protein [Archangium violaceum]
MTRRSQPGGGVAAFLSGIWLQLFWLRLASKAVPLLCLASWLWPPRERYTRWIAAGLALSLLGGLLLEAHESKSGIPRLAFTLELARTS